MNSKAIKLNGRFLSMKLNPNAPKTNQQQPRDMPFFVLD
mgnify:CR=1 FL=1|jgi:hypothetical protein